MLNVSEEIVYRWIRDKSIPVHRVHDHYRFHRAEVLEWATAHGLRVSPEEFDSELTTQALPKLSEALEAGGVHHGIAGGDREAVMRAVVARMPIDEDDRELLYDFLIAREKLGSTGVGDGIAIPHVRNPIVLHVARPSISLCFLEQPVDFDAVDARPVGVIFSLVSQTIRSHLYMLSRISAALHDASFKAAIMRGASRDDILAEARRIEAGGAKP